MIFIEATHPFHLHQAILCHLLHIECVVMDPHRLNNKDVIGSPNDWIILEAFYIQAQERIYAYNLQRVRFHPLDKTLIWFFKQNLMCVTNRELLRFPNSAGIFTPEIKSSYLNLQEAEYDMIQFLAENHLIAMHPHELPQHRLRVFLELAYAIISNQKISRETMLMCLHADDDHQRYSYLGWSIVFVFEPQHQDRSNLIVFDCLEPMAHLVVVPPVPIKLNTPFIRYKLVDELDPEQCDIVVSILDPSTVDQIQWPKLILHVARHKEKGTWKAHPVRRSITYPGVEWFGSAHQVWQMLA